MNSFITSKFFVSPLDAMFTLLSFIFVKELQATPLQLILLVASKPLVGLLSFYGNVIIKGAPDRLKPFIIALNILGALPCLFFPYISSTWFFLISYALFIMSVRATVPAWAELLKINLPKSSQAKTFSYGSAVNYLVNLFFPLLVASWLDHSPQLWRWIFFLLGCIQVLNILVLCNMKMKGEASLNGNEYNLRSIQSILFEPWKNFFNLMRSRPDFLSYQIMFFIGGVGLVVIQPVLPIFYKETLNLTYTQLTFATHFCKGICFALSSPLWAYTVQKINIYKFNFFINICSCIFIVLLLSSQFNLVFIYLAFAVYGIMQSGCELSWNLSGLIFAEGKDSTLYTGSNLAAIGMRGCICPFISQLLMQTAPSTAFLFAGCMCVLAILYAYNLSQKALLCTNLSLVH